LAPLRSAGWRYWTVFLGILLLVPAVPILLTELLHTPGVAALSGALTPLLGGAALQLRRGTELVTSTTRKIAKAQADLASGQACERAELDKELAAAEQALAAVTRQLAEATKVEKDRMATLAAAETALAEVTPGRVLAEFITDRLGSDDYRKHLGVPALVRRDLERLSRLIVERAGATPVAGEHAIDRIVLYIDDLDRCPTELVIKVLQAVHLLLAFPLFVVVVAVDSRWLATSLRQHYQQLDGLDATPADYLEKLFQVPFQLRPLESDTRAGMLDGLFRPNLAAATDGPADEEITTATMSDKERGDVSRVLDSFRSTEPGRAELAGTALTVTPSELDEIRAVADLLGTTPRAVKRFVNTYLLVKAMGQGLEPLPDGQLGVLLAIASGLPRLAAELFPMLILHRPPTAAPLEAALSTLQPASSDRPDTRVYNAERHALSTWLVAHPETPAMSTSDLVPWLELISRFQFVRSL
jgi:hypothetical protein